ncbi:MAG: PadR family transcriptional regulator [Anaerolineales bacterium]|nr:PadR family transcriptional regulator [Anaerolineales bacterium]
MSLDHAILGFLNYRAISGYDLKKMFDNSVQHFWPADQSQIYRTLRRLEEQGYVEMEKIEQTSRPDRKVYHITASGREELRRWLMAPPPMDAPRSAPLVQIFFLGQMPNEMILEKFEGFAAMMRGILQVYDQVPSKIGEYIDMVGSPRETYFWLLTLDMGIRTTQAHLEWAENVIKQLKAGQVPKEYG